MTKKPNGAELERLYKEADTVDSESFAEMRSNVLLVSGDHYVRKSSSFWNRIKDNRDLSQEQKLRLTKNHIQYITKIYVSNILAGASNTTIIPNNSSELSDQKTAELNNSVLSYLKKNLQLRQKTRDSAEDFVTFGEVYCKLFFDPTLGEVKAWGQLTDELGNPLVDEMGNPIPDKKAPVMTGSLVVERVYAFNLLRDPGVQDIDDSPYLIIRKMVRKEKLKEWLGPKEQDSIEKETTEDETYLIFDSEKGSYQKTKDYIMIREHYYRPCMEYPQGYYYICVKSQVISEGELPYGVFPIIGKGFNKVPTTARYFSPIKQARPYQVEINRCASQIATTQITLGDDKLVLYNGAKISNGGVLPGVRAITVSGGMTPPTVLSGRSGDQYLAYMQSQIDELYKVMDVYEVNPVREGNLDPYALLYHSMRNKQKFSKYCEAFEEFIIARDEKLLDMARYYFDEDTIIPMIGKNEIVNISEFKNSTPNAYKFRVEATSDDAETMLGKQLAMNHTLQYVGGSLEKDDIGRIVRAMPFLNQEAAFNPLTIDYDNATNDILSLERGEMPQVNPYDNHVYAMKMITHRMKQPDFKFLAPQIQQNFMMYLQAHEQAEVQNQQAIQMAQSGYIPTGGYLVTCDFYISMPDGKTQRARLPYEAINWLIDKLEQQGTNLANLETLNQGALADMASMMTQAQTGEQNNQQLTPEQLQGLPGGLQ